MEGERETKEKRMRERTDLEETGAEVWKMRRTEQRGKGKHTLHL